MNEEYYQKGKAQGTIKNITSELIGGYLLYGFILGIFYAIIGSIITEKIVGTDLNMAATVSVICSGILGIIVWKLSIKSTFKKKLIAREDIPGVMKNITVFIIVIIVLSGALNYLEFKEEIDEIKEKYTSAYRMLDKYGYSNESKELIEKTEQEIDKQVKTYYTYLGIVETGQIIVYIAILYMIKKDIEKYIIEEDEIL